MTPGVAAADERGIVEIALRDQEQRSSYTCGERIDLRFSIHDDAVVAASLLGRRGALISGDGLGVGLPTDGSAGDVHDALSVMVDAGVSPLTLDLRRPTLDDVFAAVTEPAA